MRLYILKDRKALRVHNVLEWARMFEATEGRIVAQDLLDNIEPWLTIDHARHAERSVRMKELLGHQPAQLRTNWRRIFVSTVFLGIDHAFGAGPPLLFETMVFNGPLTDTQIRYADWDSAAAGHLELVTSVRAALASPSSASGATSPQS